MPKVRPKDSRERRVLANFQKNLSGFMDEFEGAMRYARGEPEPPVPETKKKRFAKNVLKAIRGAREALNLLEQKLRQGDLSDVVLSEGNGLVIIEEDEKVTRFEIRVHLKDGFALRAQNTPGVREKTLAITASKRSKR